jgi:hypothetical protein
VTRLLLFFPLQVAVARGFVRKQLSLASQEMYKLVVGVLFFPPAFLCNFLLKRKGICLLILTACIIRKQLDKRVVGWLHQTSLADAGTQPPIPP